MWNCVWAYYRRPLFYCCWRLMFNSLSLVSLLSVWLVWQCPKSKKVSKKERKKKTATKYDEVIFMAYKYCCWQVLIVASEDAWHRNHSYISYFMIHTQIRLKSICIYCLGIGAQAHVAHQVYCSLVWSIIAIGARDSEKNGVCRCVCGHRPGSGVFQPFHSVCVGNLFMQNS